MKLHSIKINNYRIHREFEAAFDPSLTLVGGPNESGKSTLAEAAFNALFMKAKRGGADREKMISISGGTPAVELVFEASGQTYTVRKTFRGPQGTVALSASGGGNWNGDAAEEKLLEICGITDAVGRAIPSQWEHLWVRQGTAGSDPSALATGHKDALIKRLQNTGAAAVFQSDLDARVAAGVAADRESLLTARGPRAGSEFDLAGRAAVAASGAREVAEKVSTALDLAAADFEQATRELADSDRNLGTLNADLLKTRQALARVAELRALMEKQSLAASHKSGEFQRLASGDASIKDLSARIAAESEALAPREAGLVQCAEAEAKARTAYTDAEAARVVASQRMREVRLRFDLATLCVKRFEQADKVAGLQERAAQARSLRARHAALPAVTPTQVKSLEKHDREREKLASTLAAISTRIEVLDSDLPIVADGQPLNVGSRLVFSDVAEISVGAGTRLRITPGGGTGLAETRRKLAEAEADLQSELDTLGVVSVAEASTASAQRAEIAVRLEGSESLEQELADAATLLSATDEDIRRREAGEFSPAADAPAAIALQAACQTACDEAAAVEGTASGLLKSRFKELDAAVEASQSLRTGLQQVKATIDGLKGQLTQLVADHGDDEGRAKKLADLASAKSLADAELTATQKSFDDLQPSILEADEKRLTRAVAQNQETKTTAGERLAVATNTLRREGTSDPRADVARARAIESSALERLGTAKRHADAIALLDSLFSTEQQALTDQLTKPLADKVSGYLQCLFGPAAGARVVLTDGAFESLTLIRPETDAFEFSALSVGTQEQTAVAFRFAMAEILAQDHDGCLPVFLDDAFTNSDAARVASLQRMLDLAATRGLQIIVLSCSPQDYASLGARTITLQPPARTVLSSIPTAESETDEEDASGSEQPVPTAISDESRDAFLAALSAVGGKSSSTGLRRSLGWEAATYKAVKEELLADGKIEGDGRSVSLPDTE